MVGKDHASQGSIGMGERGLALVHHVHGRTGAQGWGYHGDLWDIFGSPLERGDKGSCVGNHWRYCWARAEQVWVPGAGYDDPLTIQGGGWRGDREVSNQATRSSCPARGR